MSSREAHTAPPRRTVQLSYSGFQFDSTTEPALRIAVEKREKILTATDFVLQQKKPSRLVLSIIAGLLESFSAATPS
jgi:hypothetical protein